VSRRGVGVQEHQRSGIDVGGDDGDRWRRWSIGVAAMGAASGVGLTRFGTRG
jgi:hypothetical protein